MKTSKILLVIAAATALGLGAAQATLINGSITFGGSATMNGTSQTATQVNSFVNFHVEMSDGDFSAATFPDLVSTTVGVSGPWIFSPPPGNAVSGLWSVAGFTFDLQQTVAVTRDPATLALDVMGVGTITGNGFDPTPGEWHYTSQDPASRGFFSFSAGTAVSPVPDGGSTVALLGAALFAVGALRARFAKA